jgi:hypothetical protein
MSPQQPNGSPQNTRLFTKDELNEFVRLSREEEAHHRPITERLKKAFSNVMPTPLQVGGFVVHVATTVDGEQARWKAHREKENMVAQPDVNERYLVVEKKNGDIYAFKGIVDETGTFTISRALQFDNNTTANHSIPDRDDAFTGRTSSDSSQWNNQTIGQLVAQYQASLVTKDPQNLTVPWKTAQQLDPSNTRSR